MANKLVAAFLVCIVVAAALNIRTAEAAVDANAEKYKSCFNTCKNECKAEGKGSTDCEKNCDVDCLAKTIADVLNIK